MKILKVAQSLSMDSKTVERLYAAFEKNAGKQLQMGFGLALDILKSMCFLNTGEENMSVHKGDLDEYFDTKSNTVEFLEFCKIYLYIKKIQ